MRIYKVLLVILLVLICFRLGQPQTFEWVKGTGSPDVQANAILTDNNGNSYITGYFNNAAAFGNIILVSRGKSDAFIAKYNNSGTLLWEKQIGVPHEEEGYEITTEKTGNVYFIGRVGDNAIFDSIKLKAGGFIAKIRN